MHHVYSWVEYGISVECCQLNNFMATDDDTKRPTYSNPDPDIRPSDGRIYKDVNVEDEAGDSIRWIVMVRGLGVMVVRTNRKTRSIQMGTFTKGEIGPCPEL